MSPKLLRILACIVFFLAIVKTPSCVTVKNGLHATEKNTSLRTLLDKKIKYYRRLHPKITFLNLQSQDELPTLDLILGYQPKSLDYEHPVELHEELMYVSAERIWLMLQSKLPSASAFKADTPLGWKENVCVLTINPDEIAADSIQSTQHLLDLPQEVIQKIPRDMQLPPNDYLAFVIDHEIYHCLKSIYVGPQLMSHKEFWASYNHFHEEQGADAYALGMHIKNGGEDSIFAKNILIIRGMSLYNADPEHLTCKAMEHVLKIPSRNIAKMSPHEIFDMANKIKNRLAVSYDEYIQYLASAVEAIKELEREEQISDDLLNKIKGFQAVPTQVETLVANARRCFSELCADEFESEECK